MLEPKVRSLTALDIYKEKTKNLIPDNALTKTNLIINRPKKPDIITKTEFTSNEVKDIYKEMLKDLKLRNDLSYRKKSN